VSWNFFFYLLKCALCNFLLIKGTLLWLGITFLFLVTLGQRLPGAAGVQTPDPQIASLMTWQSATVTPYYCFVGLYLLHLHL